uniref:Uncharacterized protein n=1 Tax=Pseudo-nitzschia australis TaxID=44445 RepID=A0A6V0CLF0_9STRA
MDLSFREDMEVKVCTWKRELKGVGSNRRTTITGGGQHGDFLARPGGLSGGPGSSFIDKVFFSTGINNNIRGRCILGIAEGMIEVGSGNGRGGRAGYQGVVANTYIIPRVECVVCNNGSIITKGMGRGEGLRGENIQDWARTGVR